MCKCKENTDIATTPCGCSKKWLWIILGLAALVGGIGYWFWKKDKAA